MKSRTCAIWLSRCTTAAPSQDLNKSLASAQCASYKNPTTLVRSILLPAPITALYGPFDSRNQLTSHRIAASQPGSTWTRTVQGQAQTKMSLTPMTCCGLRPIKRYERPSLCCASTFRNQTRVSWRSQWGKSARTRHCMGQVGVPPDVT